MREIEGCSALLLVLFCGSSSITSQAHKYKKVKVEGKGKATSNEVANSVQCAVADIHHLFYFLHLPFPWIM